MFCWVYRALGVKGLGLWRAGLKVEPPSSTTPE